MGMLCSLGHDHQSMLASLHALKNPLKSVPSCIGEGTELLGAVNMNLPAIPKGMDKYACRNNQLLIAAVDQIRKEVVAVKNRFGAGRIGIILGSSTSGIDEGTLALKEQSKLGAFPSIFDLRQQEMGSVSGFLARYLDIQGPTFTISTACSSSGKALIAAGRMIQAGICDAVITGGADSLCELTRRGFAALEAVSPERTNPMSKNRKGINIGEGAALFLMTREPSTVKYLGGGESSDAHHMSAPEPQGLGAEASMRAALRSSGLNPSDIDYINLHGTATSLNDRMESLAVARVFGERVPCSSTKPFTGHTLGASGAIEAGICWLSLVYPEPKHVIAPPHIWDYSRDPELPRLNLVDNPDGGRLRKDSCIMLSNSFAFGGSNCSVILGRST